MYPYHLEEAQLSRKSGSSFLCGIMGTMTKARAQGRCREGETVVRAVVAQHGPPSRRLEGRRSRGGIEVESNRLGRAGCCFPVYDLNDTMTERRVRCAPLCEALRLGYSCAVPTRGAGGKSPA